MKVELRKTGKKDIQVLSEIYKTEFSKPPYNEPWTIEKAIKKLKFFMARYESYSILADKEIVGFIVINTSFLCPGEAVYGEEFAVKENFQNKGVGTFVLKELFKIYGKKGYKKFYGIVSVDSKAKNLYERLGILLSKEYVFIEKNLEKKNDN